MKKEIRLAVDIGGTFTDAILQNGEELISAKIPTTVNEPARAFIEIARTLVNRAGISTQQITSIVHGTTIATNALIERKGANTAFITTQGFRDSLEIGYESRHDQYDLGLEKMPPLVPRYNRLIVNERILTNGQVDTPLDTKSLDALGETLSLKEFDSIAVGLIHAYANPVHEIMIRDYLRTVLPNIPVSLSSEVCPEIREYERFSTTVADAYVKPVIKGYLESLKASLAEEHYLCPLFLVTSAGGLMDTTTAMEKPILLVESGPSGGAIMSELVAKTCNETKAVSFDMGGTTAKICLIDGFKSKTTRQFEAARSEKFTKGSGMPLRIPVTEMIEIGAGGGSIASLDALQRVQVGPRSAGSEPGPACYGRGGTKVTVTDANLLLGRLDAERFAEGQLALDVNSAKQALVNQYTIDECVTESHAAGAVIEMVDENMANATRIHAMEHGRNLTDCCMIAFGGGGPLHAANLADKLGINRVIIPNLPGVGAALGFLAMPALCELSRSHYMTLEMDTGSNPKQFDEKVANMLLVELSNSAQKIVSDAMPGKSLSVTRLGLMRYAGQGHEIEIELPDDLLQNGSAEIIRKRYTETYKNQYGRDLPNGEIEILSFMVRVVSERPSIPAFNSLTTIQKAKDNKPNTYRKLVLGLEGLASDAPVWLREKLISGDTIQGPALVIEAQTTTVIPDNFTCHVDSCGFLILQRKTNTSSQPLMKKAENDFRLQAQWNRLQSIVDEQAAVLMRTAFSPIVRESGDLSVGVFDVDGRMLVQAITGTPGHVNTMASACEKFFSAFPPQEMQQGDIYLTNDPWAGAGHLNDFVVLQPCFFDETLIGFVSCTSHLVDIGGRCLGPDGNDVYDEGLYIPHLLLCRNGKVDQTFLTLLKANSRSASQAEGDLFALIACCEHGALRLAEMLQDFKISNLESLSRRIISSSQLAVSKRINALNDGEYPYAMTVDGYEDAITIDAVLKIKDDELLLDFYSSAPLSKHGINVPLNYTVAYAVFGLKCAIAPDVPNNHGSLLPFVVTATPNTILNAGKPAPVCSRHILGQLLPDISLGCLRSLLPETVPAEGAATLWDLPMQGVFTDSGETFAQELVFNGGTGARPNKDGLSATAFPSGVMGSLVEITESTTPILIRRRELRPGSGGAGQYRGGHGQIVSIEAIANTQLTVYGTVDRVAFPARGANNGQPGKTGKFVHSSGIEFSGKGCCLLLPGETLTIYTPGGGGFGDVDLRNENLLQFDKLNALESPEHCEISEE